MEDNNMRRNMNNIIVADDLFKKLEIDQKESGIVAIPKTIKLMDSKNRPISKSYNMYGNIMLVEDKEDIKKMLVDAGINKKECCIQKKEIKDHSFYLLVGKNYKKYINQ